MNQEVCKIQGHELEELIYVCSELQCIELKNNKLNCSLCLCKHRGVTYNILRENAINNYNQYKQNLQNDIDENEILKKNVESSLKEIQGKIMKMLSDLQKKIFTFVDRQSQILQTNKNKAQQLMQDSNPSLDIQIFFAKFFDTEAKWKQETTKQQVKAIIKDLIDDINQKIEYLKQPDVNEYKIIEVDLQSFEIGSIFQKKLPCSYCDEHCTKKSSICIDMKCLQSNNLVYHCLRCSKATHFEHYKNDYLFEYDKLKKEQKIKQKFLVKQKQIIKENVEKLVNDQLNELKIEQKEQYLKYQISIENIKSLYQQFEIMLIDQDKKFVFGDLLLQFITTKEQELELQLNQVQKIFENQMKCFRIQEKEKFSEECKLLQLKQEEIFKLEKKLLQLKQVIDQNDKLLQSQSPDNLLQMIFANTKEIMKEKDKQIQLLLNNDETLKGLENLQKVHENLQKDYENLQKDYENLQKKYENLQKVQENLQKDYENLENNHKIQLKSNEILSNDTQFKNNNTQQKNNDTQLKKKIPQKINELIPYQYDKQFRQQF